MKKSCQYCGRIHDSKYNCGKKPKSMKRYNAKDKFRSSAEWQAKRKAIKERDHYLCQICLQGLYQTIKRFNYEELEVHHIIPLEENETKKLENGNLITLCKRHHEMAEAGEIPRAVLLRLTAQNIPPGGAIYEKAKGATPTAHPDK